MKKAINIPAYSLISILLLFISFSFNTLNKSDIQADTCINFSATYGPGAHFIDSSAAGIDSMNTRHCCEPLAIITMQMLNPYILVTDSVHGENIVSRSDPSNHSVATELLEMTMNGDFNGDPLTVTAGAGKGKNPILGSQLLPTYGAMVEEIGDEYHATSFFDVFIEIEILDIQNILPGPTDTIYLYNQQPIHLSALIDRIPPECGRDSSGIPYTTFTTPPLTSVNLYTDLRLGLGELIATILGVDKALPVELASFSSVINENNITLNWTTASEKNNAGFEIERYTVDNGWNKIGFVNGAGTSEVTNNYSYEDRNLNSGRYSYRLKQTDYNGNFRYYNLANEAVIGIPGKFSLSQNYPNPFNPSTKIDFDISRDGMITMKLYDNSGREIKTLLNEFRSAGFYTYKLDGRDLASGVYYYRLESDGKIASKKMILLK